jgi:hypothetical protein
MTINRAFIVLVAIISLTSACNSDAGSNANHGDMLNGVAGDLLSPVDGGAACPLDKLQWQLVKSVVQQLIDDSLTITDHSRDQPPYQPSVGSQYSPVEQNVGSGYDFGMVSGQPCAPMGPSCNSMGGSPSDPFFLTHDACFRITCAGATVYKSQAYWTMLPDTTQPYSYTVGIADKVTYTPNPNVTWTVDRTIASSVSASAGVLNNVTYVHGAETIDLSHTGTISVAASPSVDAPATLQLSLSFPKLTGSTIVANASLDALAKPTGTVAQGSQMLGAFSSTASSGGNWYVKYAWQGPCESP